MNEDYEDYEIYELQRRIRKVERNCRAAEDRYYEENDGEALEAFAKPFEAIFALLEIAVKSVVRMAKKKTARPERTRGISKFQGDITCRPVSR